jgi:hypothetical protein
MRRKNDVFAPLSADEDHLVPDYENSSDPHMSYFLPGNTAVQREIVAKTILKG